MKFGFYRQSSSSRGRDRGLSACDDVVISRRDGTTNLAEVVGRAAAARDERDDAVALEELFEVALHGVDERLIGGNLQLAVQERLRHNIVRHTDTEIHIQIFIDTLAA